MKKYPNLLLGILFAATLALAALQGRRVDHLRDSERFYRWIVAAAGQFRLFGEVATDTSPAEADLEQPKEMKDEALFADVVQAIESDVGVPEPPSTKDDFDKDNKPYAKLVRVVRAAGEAGDGSRVFDAALWKYASAPKAAPQRREFLTYLRNGQLASLGTQFGASDLYSSEGSINLSNLFFGFRKMAANLLWLQVEKYWHQGMLYKMVPIMKTTVALDPNFVDAYLIGAWHLAYNATAHMPNTPEPLKQWYPRYHERLGDKELLYYEAIDFLKDGIYKNPRNYKLYFDLGYGIYELKLKDHPNVVKYLSEAIRYRHENYVRRMLYHCLEHNKRYEDALAGWEKYYAENPGTNLNIPGFIAELHGFIKEREADQAEAQAQTAENAAREARQKSNDALTALGSARQAAATPEEIQALESASSEAEARAGEVEQAATSARESADRLFEEARKSYQEIIEISGGDQACTVQLLKMNVRKLVEEGRFWEAIMYLQHGRWQNLTYFDELSDLIIEIKLKANLALTLSERQAVLRREEAAQFLASVEKTVTGLKFMKLDGGWCQEEYGDERTRSISAESELLAQLRQQIPDLTEILALAEPGKFVVFQAGDTWYKYQG
ncbi:MAG: hypothetical protein HY706_19390 [Candidatus Hydrogenedentes bacterium]|nr:hypothetical protein [Candidatus Hydrogenedentota bacterium]